MTRRPYHPPEMVDLMHGGNWLPTWAKGLILAMIVNDSFVLSRFGSRGWTRDV